MAIIKDIEVTVEVNEQPLQEYECADDDDNCEDSDHDDGPEGDEQAVTLEDRMPYVASKYIEASSNTSFTIKMVVPELVKSIADALYSKICIDGVHVRAESNLLAMRDRKKKDGVWMHRARGAGKETKQGMLVKPFLFTEIKTLDTSSGLNPSDVLCTTDLGLIMVKVWRKKVIGSSQNKLSTSDYKVNLQDNLSMDEKEIKGRGLTHSVSLGQEQKGRRPEWWYTKYIDGKDSPFAIWYFKYRSRQALQFLGLIDRTPSPPRDPTPVPLEARSFEELSMEEMQELARRQQARYKIEQETSIKSETGIKSENGVKLERGIKRERDAEVDEMLATASAKRVKGPIAPGETVDLSD